MFNRKLALALVVILSLVFSGVAMAQTFEYPPTDPGGKTPTTYEDWSPAGGEFGECQQVGSFMYAYKIEEPVANGTYVATFDDGHTNTIMVSGYNGYRFNFSATNPIGAVIVKASTFANVYEYDPQMSADNNLYSVFRAYSNKGVPQFYEVSHVTFCWNPEDVEYEYETAFAYGGDLATCFLQDGFNRWGWTNGPIGYGEYTWPLYAGAGQCDLSKGTLVGSVLVVYAIDSFDVTYTVNAPYMLLNQLGEEETHVYAGAGKYPLNNNVPTVAPGQYYIENPLNGEIYVIAHAVVAIPK